MILNETIKEISQKAAQPLFNTAQTGAKNIREFVIDCSLLEDYNQIDVTQADNFKNLFLALNNLNGPCLYYFTILSTHQTQELINDIKEYKNSFEPKSVPAIKKYIPESNILYVGKVKRHMASRIVQHFGYYKIRFTQGLQLYYWTRKNNLQLKLTVLEFEPEMANLMAILELELAKQLKPILGKHR